MYILENELLKVTLDERGAELTGIYHKSFQRDYMWNADPAFWPKHSPVLFPIIGGLKNDTYFFDDKPYQLPRHGFAREKIFSVTQQSTNVIKFSLRYDEETLLVYPFLFALNISYTLFENTLTVAYEVQNLLSDEMFFSIGGHPAFKVPLLDDMYEDYYLEFNSIMSSKRWPVSSDGLIEAAPVSFFNNNSTIPLTKKLFLPDALVFKDLPADKVSLKCNKHAHGLDFYFSGFPSLGIWAAKNADFVCIEPWCGIGDSVGTDQQLKNKEGINKLMKGESFRRAWKVALW